MASVLLRLLGTAPAYVPVVPDGTEQRASFLALEIQLRDPSVRIVERALLMYGPMTRTVSAMMSLKVQAAN
jgi:hypothetical protein